MSNKSNPEKGSGYKKRNKKLNPKTKGKPKYKNYFLYDIEEEDVFGQEDILNYKDNEKYALGDDDYEG